MRDPRREYIRLLQRSVDEFTPEAGQQRDATFMGELADAGYVKGSTMADASGITRGAVSWGVTAGGRLFLRRLEKEIQEESFWSRAKRWGIPLLTYVAGVATPVLRDWLKMLFHVKP